MLTGSAEKCLWKSTVPWFVLLLLVLYGVGLGIRLASLPAWDSPEMRILDAAGNISPLMATPDAYYWLAGAAGKGAAAELAPSLFLKAISDGSGLQPARAALLLPVLLAGTLGPLLALLCRSLGFSLAGLYAGLLATLAPAFLCRTGPGYYDTDMLLLPEALIMALTLLFLMRERCGTGFVWAVLSGVAMGWLQSWHRLLPLSNAAMLFVAVMLVLVRTRGNKPDVLLRLALFAASLFFSWQGSLLAGSIVLMLLFVPENMSREILDKKRVLAVLGLVLIAVALFSNLRTEGQNYLQRAQTKRISGQQDGKVLAPVYPPMTQTIAEAGRISYAQLLTLLHPWAGVALAGLCGFIWLVGKKPEALLLGPLLAFGLCAPYLGARTAMFAVPSVALGFGVGAEALLARIPLFTSRKGLFWGVRGLLTLLVSLPLVLHLPPPEPALSAPHAAALRDLGKKVPADPRSIVWTWWDFGYAARYFSGLQSFADPGRQGPEYVYFLSKMLGTDSLAGAARLMRFSAACDFHPWEELNRLGAPKAQQLMEALAAGGPEPQGEDRQFLVLSLDELRLLPVIVDFARWNLRTGAPDGTQGMFQILHPPVSIDLKSGRINAPRSDTRTEVGTLLLWNSGPDERTYDTANPLCLVALSDPEEYLLLDRRLYHSNYLRLLLGNPAWSRKWFRLVIDDAPHARVYELFFEKREGN